MAAFLVENAEKRETESVKELIAVFFEAYPDAHALQQAGWLNVHDWFKARDSAADETFAQLLSRYTFDYLFKENEKSTPHRLWGVSGFVVSCYRIFVQEDLRASTSYGGDLLNYKRRVNERLRAWNRPHVRPLRRFFEIFWWVIESFVLLFLRLHEFDEAHVHRLCGIHVWCIRCFPYAWLTFQFFFWYDCHWLRMSNNIHMIFKIK